MRNLLADSRPRPTFFPRRNSRTTRLAAPLVIMPPRIRSRSTLQAPAVFKLRHYPARAPFAHPRSAWYTWHMNKLLEQAIEEVSALPEQDQEELATRLLEEVHRRVPRKGKW